MKQKHLLLAGVLGILFVLSGDCNEETDDQSECNEFVLSSAIRNKRALLVPGQSAQYHHDPLWNYSVAFNFTQGLDDNVKMAYCEAMAVISSVSCIQFTPKSAETNYLLLTDGSDGCKSWVGQKGGEQTVWLQNPKCVTTAVAIHELLHATGMNHEHQRHDRNQYIDVDFTQIKPKFSHNFNRLSNHSSYRYHGTVYDFESIMHYSSHAFAKGRNATITPVVDLPRGTKMGKRTRLSKGDIQRIRNMYHCQDLTTPMPDIDDAFANQLNRDFWRLEDELSSGSGSGALNECLELLAPELFAEEIDYFTTEHSATDTSEDYSHLQSSAIPEHSGTNINHNTLQLASMLLIYYFILK